MRQAASLQPLLPGVPLADGAVVATAKYHAWIRAFAAVTCWLTMLAGGDDFNLARVVLPLSAPVSESPLPLDDPNTDFIRSSESPSPTTIHQGSSAPPVSAGLKVAGTG